MIYLFPGILCIVCCLVVDDIQYDGNVSRRIASHASIIRTLTVSSSSSSSSCALHDDCVNDDKIMTLRENDENNDNDMCNNKIDAPTLTPRTQ